jgi:glutathione synthase/RimK-type ligase-like ATP-grasp enzyme
MAVPETLVTTDPAAVLAFLEEHGEIIYKSVSGVRSKVSKLRSEHLERIEHVSSCPTQFQQHISGVDYRVHVVGDEVFAARLVSTADDYRYADGPGDDLEVIELCVSNGKKYQRAQGRSEA